VIVSADSRYGRPILQSERLCYTDAFFLMNMGLLDETESYLLSQVDQIDGQMYTRLLPLVQTLESNERWRTATMIYRSLLDSILARAQSKYYHHGVRYLKKLDNLATKIEKMA